MLKCLMLPPAIDPDPCPSARPARKSADPNEGPCNRDWAYEAHRAYIVLTCNSALPLKFDEVDALTYLIRWRLAWK